MDHLSYGSASLAFPGESVSGDKYLVWMSPSRILLAVIDGAGHGPGASVASALAARILEERWQESIEEQIWACHAGLTSTRGAALSIVTINCDTNSLEWAGIGDVCAAVFHRTGSRIKRHSLTTVSGVVGYGNLASLRLESFLLAPGDLICLATDGMNLDFVDEISNCESKRTLHLQPQPMAERLVSRYRRETDDALVLVARYREGEETSP